MTSKFFNIPFYLNHEYLDSANAENLKQGSTEDWKKMFQFFLSQAQPLLQSDIDLMVSYRSLPNYYGLSSEVLVTLDFNDSYEIFLDNYELYSAKIHKPLGSAFKAVNIFKPRVNFFNPNKINISIDISASHHDAYGQQEHQILAPVENQLSSLENLRIPLHYPNGLNNQSNDSDALLNLVQLLINLYSTQDDKDLEIHLFSDSESNIFKKLVANYVSKYKINLHLNLPTVEKFYFLSISDYFVCANNSLGWLASLVNPNPSFIRFPFQYVVSPTTHFFDDGLSLFKDKFILNAMAKKIWI